MIRSYKLHSEANGFFYLKLMKSSDVHDLSWSHCFYDLLVVFWIIVKLLTYFHSLSYLGYFIHLF